jgi:signal transduction histidine kinase
VNFTWTHRRHALRVAAVATLVVLACYFLAAFILNTIVVDHLVGNTDNRLADRLRDASGRVATLALAKTATVAAADADFDDAPSFLWLVGPSGAVKPLSPGAPTLPTRDWSTGPVTLPLGTSTFRFDSLRRGASTLVAGQSLASTEDVHSTLLVAELVFGAILTVAVLAGATIVGLRASAPSEFVRRRQAEFTADASHELRTPISVIEAEVELALDRPRDARDYKEVLQRVGAEGERLRHIVDDLLWLARADDQPHHSDSNIADVAEVAEACAQRFAAVARSRHVTLSTDPNGAGPFTVQAPAAWIDRLVGVLIDNACKFAGETGRVKVVIRNAGNRVELCVDDSGPGIPPEQRDAVFDRFHRASDSAEGTGLGLAIADSVVRGTEGSWHIGASDLGGARVVVSWHRSPGRLGRGDPSPETLTRSLA